MTGNELITDKPRTIIMLLPQGRELVALSTEALRQAQAPRRKLAQDYRNAYLLDADGSVYLLERIEVLGPFGTSWWRRLLSRATNGWSIRVHLSLQSDWDTERVREMVMACLYRTAEEDGQEVARLVREVQASQSKEAVFRAMRLPRPEDALDVL